MLLKGLGGQIYRFDAVYLLDLIESIRDGLSDRPPAVVKPWRAACRVKCFRVFQPHLLRSGDSLHQCSCVPSSIYNLEAFCLCVFDLYEYDCTAMGLKRKRSVNTVSSPSSTLSPPPVPFQSDNLSSSRHNRSGSPSGYSPPEPYFAAGMEGYIETTPSYLPSRTRKRFRDNRPDEATIHSNTLSLLFSAQQNHLASAPAMTPDTPGYPDTRNGSLLKSNSMDTDHGMPTPSPTPSHSRWPSTNNSLTSATRPTSSSSLQSKKLLAQQSLHAFFGRSPDNETIKRPASAHARTGSHREVVPAPIFGGDSMDTEMGPCSVQPTLPSTSQMTLDHGFSTSAPTSSTPWPLRPSTASSSRCEDCDSFLESSYESAMEMDIEMTLDGPADCLHLQDDKFHDFACCTCGKSVCDMCAVRGNERRCLECANPGNGNS